MYWKVGTSRVPMIVNNIITDIVDTIGPIELSEKTEKQIDIHAIANNDKNAKQNPPAYLQTISVSEIMTKPSLLSTIKSPSPNIHWDTISAKKASQVVKRNV